MTDLDPVFRAYGLRVFSVEPVDSVYRSRAVFRLATDRGDKCLKPFRAGPHRALFCSLVQQHLLQRGLLNLAAWEPTLDGQPFFEFRGEVFVLAPWVAGARCDLTDPEQRSLAAVTLGRFHRAARRFEAGLALGYPDGWGNWVRRYQRELRDLEDMARLAETHITTGPAGPHGRAGPSTFDRVYLAHVETYLLQGRRALETINGPDYWHLVKQAEERRVFCHKDYVGPNLLITPRRQLWLIDLDSCGYDIPLYDVTKLVMSASDWDATAAEKILEEYASVRVLRREERRLLPAAVLLPRDFWWAARLYYRGGHDRITAEKALETLRWVISTRELKEKFVQDLTRRLG